MASCSFVADSSVMELQRVSPSLLQGKHGARKDEIASTEGRDCQNSAHMKHLIRAILELSCVAQSMASWPRLLAEGGRLILGCIGAAALAQA